MNIKDIKKIIENMNEQWESKCLWGELNAGEYLLDIIESHNKIEEDKMTKEEKWLEEIHQDKEKALEKALKDVDKWKNRYYDSVEEHRADLVDINGQVDDLKSKLMEIYHAE